MESHWSFGQWYESQTWLSDFTFSFHFHALEKEMATHSSFLPGESQGQGSLVGCRLWDRRVGHDWATSLSLFTFMHWRRKWQPTPVSCLENPRDGGAWWAAVYGVTQSWTRLRWLSSSSSRGEKTIKNTNIWKLNNTFLNNQQITEEVKREIKICIERMKMKTQ